MKIVLEHDRAVLFHADASAALDHLPADSIEAMVTDPPAGIGFMGREWDSDKGGRDHWIAWLRDVMAKAYRVLKPGAHAFVWALPRTSHWTAIALEDSGFEIRDIVDHIFGTGFPKSVAVDKMLEKEQDKAAKLRRARFVQHWAHRSAKARGVSHAMIDAACGTSDMAAHWLTHPTQPEIAHEEHWPTLVGLLGEPPEDVEAAILDYLKNRNKPGDAWLAREITGVHERGTASGLHAANINFEAPPVPGEKRDAPSTAEAAKWLGWGTALKPAKEHWILVRKPLIGTVAENIRAHGTGGINIDASRLSRDETLSPEPRENERSQGATSLSPGSGPRGGNAAGRWPANVVIDDYTADLMGPASSFFYTAKPSTKERDAGCGDLPVKAPAEIVDREEGSDGMNNPRAGAGRTSGRRNFHPTVKPIALMEWLIKMITPPGGTVLDPFAGSGTTGAAALGLGFNFVGVELSEEYLPITLARVKNALESKP